MLARIKRLSAESLGVVDGECLTPTLTTALAESQRVLAYPAAPEWIVMVASCLRRFVSMPDGMGANRVASVASQGLGCRFSRPEVGPSQHPRNEPLNG